MKALSHALVLALALAGCSGGGSSNEDITIRFAARVGSESVACGETYEGLGTGEDDLTLNDFRFYVHDVALVTGGGDEVAVALTEDGRFQRGGIALLDFEDATNGCVMGGTSEMNDRVVGTVPAGDYVGLRFTLGVPFDENHQDANTAEAPLNLTSMFWVWNAGYKFVRIDGTSSADPNGFRLHLGSTACSPDGNEPTSCANPNRVDVEFASFDASSQTVVFDLAALVEGVDLGTNTADTPPGCMSAPSDPDCTAYFENLGLPFGENAGGTQSVFSVE